MYRDLQYVKFSAYGFLKNLQFFEPFLILFLLEKGIGYLSIGTLFAVREISANVLEIPTGVLADGVGRRRTMVLAFSAYLVSFAVFYVAGSFGALVLAMLLFACGDAFRTGTHKAMIMSYLRDRGWSGRKSDYYGHTRSWSQVGSAVSAVIAAIIVFYSGRYATVFAFSTVPYVLALILMLTYPRALDGETGRLSGERVVAGFRRVVGELKQAFRRPRLLRTITAAALYGGYYKGAKDYLQPLVRALALSMPIFVTLAPRQRSALFIGLVYSALYVLTSFASRFAHRVRPKGTSPARVLAWELAVGLAVGVAAGTFHAVDLPLAAVLSFFGVYLIQNLRRPVAVAFVSDAFQDGIQATALSAESQVQSFIAAAVAFAIGAVADLAGGRVGIGIVAVSLSLLLAAPLVAGRKPVGNTTSESECAG
jgi:MFS family permease